MNGEEATRILSSRRRGAAQGLEAWTRKTPSSRGLNGWHAAQAREERRLARLRRLTSGSSGDECAAEG